MSRWGSSKLLTIFWTEIIQLPKINCVALMGFRLWMDLIWFFLCLTVSFSLLGTVVANTGPPRAPSGLLLSELLDILDPWPASGKNSHVLGGGAQGERKWRCSTVGLLQRWVQTGHDFLAVGLAGIAITLGTTPEALLKFSPLSSKWH